jgi:hypothetical protein
MARYKIRSSSQECLEYHGNTAIERIRRRNGIIRRDWLFFDSVEEAADYFNDHRACQEAA